MTTETELKEALKVAADALEIANDWNLPAVQVNPPKEWVYLDVTRKRFLTYEWGGLYQRKSLRYVNGKLWEELTGGSLGFNRPMSGRF